MSPDILIEDDKLPIPTCEPIHSGKVRSVYWLKPEDSTRLVEERGYPVASDSDLAIVVISDRISAFDCVWNSEEGLPGVPGKGASLNAISLCWFEHFKRQGLARSHVLETPHPLVWIVQRAKPVLIEAVARQFVTGSMWRAYEKGERSFCGVLLPDKLKKNQRLPEVVFTPSTKGLVRGIVGVAEVDDAGVTREQLNRYWREFGFRHVCDVDQYENLLREGFDLISSVMARARLILVDTKFEFGYAKRPDGTEELIYMDEVGTPDSSRIWDGDVYHSGDILERSKEEFRQMLLCHVPDSDLLLDPERLQERKRFASEYKVPPFIMHKLSETYLSIAEQITGSPINVPRQPLRDILSILKDDFGLAS